MRRILPRAVLFVLRLCAYYSSGSISHRVRIYTFRHRPFFESVTLAEARLQRSFVFSPDVPKNLNCTFDVYRTHSVHLQRASNVCVYVQREILTAYTYCLQR